MYMPVLSIYNIINPFSFVLMQLLQLLLKILWAEKGFGAFPDVSLFANLQAMLELSFLLSHNVSRGENYFSLILRTVSAAFCPYLLSPFRLLTAGSNQLRYFRPIKRVEDKTLKDFEDDLIQKVRFSLQNTTQDEPEGVYKALRDSTEELKSTFYKVYGRES